MNGAEEASRKAPLATRRRVKPWLASFFSLLCIGLAVATLVPWGAVIPNHLGYYSACSFAPISTLMLIVLGLGIWSYGTGHQRQLKASAIVLVMLIGISGFWGYTAKMPISNLQLRLQWGYVYEVPFSLSYKSTCVLFNLTFYNPTDVDIPAFQLESFGSFGTIINGTRLVPETYEWLSGGGYYYGLVYISIREGVKAHQTETLSYLQLWVYWNKTEGGELNAVLLALNQSKFSLTFSGLIVVRTWYITSPESTPGLLVAAAPFEVSFRSP